MIHFFAKFAAKLADRIRCGNPRAPFLLITAGMAAWPAVAQQPPSPEYLAAQTVAAAAWPHTTKRDGAIVTVYQPQAIADNIGSTQRDQRSAGAGTMERGNYQQLEQDRLGRQAGSGRWGGTRGSGSGGARSRQR